jgi:two-component system, LuxR family, response regulator FixJ
VNGSKGNIVVVEDDPAMNLALRRLLRASGFHPQGFESAEELLEDGAAARGCCLILDVHLGGTSGFELRRQLQLRGTDCPTIFITADESASLPESDYTAGFLRKPFSAQRLLAAIRQALDRDAEKRNQL